MGGRGDGRPRRDLAEAAESPDRPPGCWDLDEAAESPDRRLIKGKGAFGSGWKTRYFELSRLPGTAAGHLRYWHGRADAMDARKKATGEMWVTGLPVGDAGGSLAHW